MSCRGVAAFLLGCSVGVAGWAWFPQPTAGAAHLSAARAAGLRVYGNGQILYAGRGPEAWHAAAAAAQHQLDRARADLRRRFEPTVLPAIQLAAIAEHVPYQQVFRTIRCETGGTFDPYAANPHSSARGLGQFLTTGPARRYGDGVTVDGGTWATTPFSAFSPYDPYANAAAVAWMWSVGRGGEFCG